MLSNISLIMFLNNNSSFSSSSLNYPDQLIVLYSLLSSFWSYDSLYLYYSLDDSFSDSVNKVCIFNELFSLYMSVHCLNFDCWSDHLVFIFPLEDLNYVIFDFNLPHYLLNRSSSLIPDLLVFILCLFFNQKQFWS